MDLAFEIRKLRAGELTLKPAYKCQLVVLPWCDYELGSSVFLLTVFYQHIVSPDGYW